MDPQKECQENFKTKPITPYGKSKLKFEKFLEKSKKNKLCHFKIF